MERVFPSCPSGSCPVVGKSPVPSLDLGRLGPPPLSGAPEEQAGDGLLHVGASEDGGGNALGDELVDVGEGGQPPELLLLLWGHGASKGAAWAGRGDVGA